MDFKYSAEQVALGKIAADFARDKLVPHADNWNLHAYFPIEVLREAAQLGMGGMFAREDIGGANLTRLDAAIIFEQLATGCISTSAFLSIHNMVTSLIDRYADAKLRSTWGPRLTCMELLASYCLTEPDSGSDAASLKTQARRDGDFYMVDGVKAFISGGSVSDVYLCMVRTGADRHH